MCTGNLRMRFPDAWKSALVIAAAATTSPSSPMPRAPGPDACGSCSSARTWTNRRRDTFSSDHTGPTVSGLSTPHCRLRLALH